MRDILLEIVNKTAPRLGLDGLPELYNMVMHDYRPSFTKGIYVFIETEDNWGSAFRAASGLIKRDAATEVYSVWHKKWKGSPGYEKWKDKLERFVGFGRVKYIGLDDLRRVNTLSESMALIRFANENQMDSFYLVAPPFHMLRAFMTAVSVAISYGVKINLFAYPGVPQDLNQIVAHSQGEVRKSRRDIFETEELPRIKTYSTDKKISPILLAPAPVIMEYMKKRKLKF